LYFLLNYGGAGRGYLGGERIRLLLHDIVLDPILVQLLGLLCHPQSGRYRTILKQYSLTHELSSLDMRDCVRDLILTKDKIF